MKLLVILFTVMFAGCTIEVKPIKSHRRYQPSSKPKKSRQSSRAQPIVVDPAWIESYKHLEKEFDHTVPGDEKIKPVNGKFSVPRSVVDHFDDMTHASPSPY
jgi:hypothetical protein